VAATLPGQGSEHLELAKESLRELLEDRRVPAPVRETLADDYRQIQAMLDKLEYGQIHIAVFGRVSVGKSAVLNALLGEQRFRTSPLHGETKAADWASWREIQAGGVFLIDTPGINEIEGEARERLAHEVASRSDLVLFVLDGDMTASELTALRQLAAHDRPIILVLNKTDRLTGRERDLVLESLAERIHDLVVAENIVPAAAMPAERIYVQVDEQGRETEVRRSPPPDVAELRSALWRIVESEGMTLAALNAALFAGSLSDQVSRRIVEIRRGLAEKVVRTYCITKGVAVAINPIPITDLIAASAIDATMIVHLGQVYGLQVNRRQAGALIRTIAAQMALLTGTVWTVHLISSALKGGTLGLSTLVTAAAQGAVAYYSTHIVGQAAEEYFARGQSWGERGPKRVVQEILNSTNRESILEQGRQEIFQHLKTS
jgi:GTP-binding protein Era